MNLKLIFCSLFLIPISLSATSLETQIADLLGKSYKSEAAQSFFKTHQLKSDFPERTAFTFNFYEQGVSIKINGGEFIQAIQVYSETMFFKTFAKPVYGKKLSEIYGANDIYKVIKMAPISEDKVSGTFIYPNKKPADYLVRVVRKPDNTMRAIAWVLDENAMEEIIAKTIEPMNYYGVDSHDAVWELLGQKIETKMADKLFEGPMAASNDNRKLLSYDKELGMHIYSNYAKKAWYFKDIEFKRRGHFGAKINFPHALPEGLFWWSSPDDFAKVLTLKTSKPEVGVYVFEKDTAVGTMSAVFSMGMLTHVRFTAKQVK